MGSEFDNACTFIRANPSKFGNTDLLYFYARFKIVTEGQCTTEKPAFYQLKEKSKWQTWIDLGDLDPDIAETEYIERYLISYRIINDHSKYTVKTDLF